MRGPWVATGCTRLIVEEAHLDAHVGQDLRLELVEADAHAHRGLGAVRRGHDVDDVRRQRRVRIGVERRFDALIALDAIDVRLVDVHFDFARVHVDDGGDAGAREAAAGRHRRDHFAGLRVLGDDHAVERRAHVEIVVVDAPHGEAAFGHLDLRLRGREPRGQCVHFGARGIERRLAHELLLHQRFVALEIAARFREAHFDFGEIAARRRRARARPW